MSARCRDSLSRWLLLLGAVVPLSALAVEQTGTQLKLPKSSAEMRQYMQSGDSRCPGCGVVNSVRRVAVGDGGNAPAEANDLTNRTGDAGVGDDIRTVPIVGSRKDSSRKKVSAPGMWRVIVRYDDGTYASFDQADQPKVIKGQRIHVVSGRVEPR